MGSSARPWNPSNKPVRAPGWHSLEHVTPALRFLSSKTIKKKTNNKTTKPTTPSCGTRGAAHPPVTPKLLVACRILYSRSHPLCGPVGCPPCPPPPLGWEPTRLRNCSRSRLSGVRRALSGRSQTPSTEVLLHGPGEEEEPGRFTLTSQSIFTVSALNISQVILTSTV